MFKSLACAAAVLAASLLSSSARAQLQDENVLVLIPHGFKAGWQGANGPMTTVEYVPTEESVDDWSQMITQQIFHGRTNEPPDSLPTFMGTGWRAGCPGGAGRKLSQADENGYPSAIWVFTCPRNPQTGKPETAWIKVISGADSLYSVQYAVRREATDETTRAALTYLQRVTACDTRRADRPCPKAPKL
ncbi:hypothetical protein [Phenylobacterium sp.]|jgi:hypothetical protein|uniref:hypothetical protein n=1 Tax=Phenylobacterium sp. TaxID=1871053 RepID=UPI002E374BE8|nr:hypothetical protein [Phenylobacterium sp.]HEX3364402.1 hypothetical protein [Phenylobacterium sp.]